MLSRVQMLSGRVRQYISAGNMNERGRERTAAGLGTVGRRWAGEGWGARGACLLTFTRVSCVF